ncbi:hypothetical protein ACQPWW_09535 [Micromonospora sp. CA-240977]|uniref:hypothetical protein n=1 Tax=Micromonospora sp. CA-240977 TaxID=3239957 RepID=UPI003D8E190A
MSIEQPTRWPIDHSEKSNHPLDGKITMHAPRRRHLVLAAAAGLATTLLAPAAAQAAYFGNETDYAVYSLGPDGDPIGNYECVTFTGVVACLKETGDRIYVKDTKADGYAAVAEWEYPFDDRTGSCVNKLQAGDWGVCNKDFSREDWYLYVRGARYNSGNFVDGGLWEKMYI